MLLKNEEERKKWIDAVIRIASNAVGVRERGHNQGWFDAKFQTFILKYGGFLGAPWCMMFARAVWIQAAEECGFLALAKEIKKLTSASTISSGSALDNSPLFDTTTAKRKRSGALIIWRKGRLWQGHVGIIEKVLTRSYKTIEGNTGADAREGDVVARKNRTDIVGNMHLFIIAIPKIEGEK